MQRIKVLVRDRYFMNTVGSKPKILSGRRVTYSIIDVETGTTIVPFSDDYTLFSNDSGSNYFKQDLRGFITNRSYRIRFFIKNIKYE